MSDQTKRWEWDEDFLELADKLNGDRCLWFWHAVHHTLPSIVWRIQTILDSDQRATIYTERLTQRAEFQQAVVSYQYWLSLRFGYKDFALELLAFVDQCEGGRDHFRQKCPDAESLKIYLDRAKELPEIQSQARADPSDDSKNTDYIPVTIIGGPRKDHLCDPFKYLRFLPSRYFDPVVTKLLSDAWWFDRIKQVLDPVLVHPDTTDAWFIDSVFRESVKQLASDLAKRHRDNDHHAEYPKTVSTAELATAAGVSGSQIRQLKKEGVIVPVMEGKPGKAARWDLRETLATLGVR